MKGQLNKDTFFYGENNLITINQKHPFLEHWKESLYLSKEEIKKLYLFIQKEEIK